MTPNIFIILYFYIIIIFKNIVDQQFETVNNLIDYTVCILKCIINWLNRDGIVIL